ncbi:hypothetical protein GCM10027405_10920 [Arthrobacter alkaliphilus]|uniref:glycosyltransferase family 2 protein n=1 Tax=Arthrobacter alkaliphilus TaxID=369936 RepID=UPI001F399E80|nr:glycosyltransferase [Arthrobacter alkaliphilus]
MSILVISYNQQDLIFETVESCLGQTYKNIQIVVSDDGSSDRTPEILRELKERYPERIKLVLNPKNSGITANCNIGLAACDGEFVALMGGDDLLLPQKVELQVHAFMDDPELVLSYHPCDVSVDNRVVDKVGHRDKDLVSGLIDMIGKFEAQLPGPATMVRASAVPEDGFDSSIPTASDWLFFIDVSSRGRVSRLNETLAIYRQHGGNVGHRYFDYSGDFIRTIEIAGRRYGHIDGVASAAKRGARRFLLGIIYRSISQGELKRARVYTAQLPQYASWMLGVGIYLITYIPGAGGMFRLAKSFLKRYV